MIDPHGKAGAYFDGELDEAGNAAFLEHLASCASCQRDLDDAMQLAVREPGLRAVDDAPALSEPRSATALETPARRRRRALWIAAPAALVAAVLLIVLVRRGPAPELALGPTRHVEARLSYALADRHRPFDVELGKSPATELVPPRTLAALEERGARDALVAAYVLAGEDRRAQAVLDAMPAAPERDSDLAAVALARHAPLEALEAADRALAHRPRFAPALWNRALALQQLELPLAAAAAFDEVAALGEPGWAAEAAARAASLRAAITGRRRAWDDVGAAGLAMAQSDSAPVLTAEQARRVPGVARLYFYDAVRTAASAARLAALAPLARVLDDIDHSRLLTRALEQAGRRDLAMRRSLAEQYRALMAGTLSGAEIDQALAGFRAAHADDLTFGGLLYARQQQSHLDELTRLAEATGDPWFVLLARGEAAVQLHVRGEDLAAEAALRAALAMCTSPGVAYRCLRLGRVLQNLLVYAYRTSELRQLTGELAAQARATGDWYIEGETLVGRAEAERLTLQRPVLRALYDEIARRAAPKDCAIRDYLRQVQADDDLLELDADGAAHRLDALERCGDLSPTALADLVDVARLRPGDERRARVREQIAAYRARATPLELPWAAVIEGRFEIETDRARGAALLRDGIRLAAAQPTGLARRARTIAYASLIVDAAAAGDFARGLALFGEAAEVAPDGCALGVAVDDNRSVAIARLADGSVRGAYDAARTRPLAETESAVPPALAAALAPCDHVSVLALAPLHGRPDLLAPSLPWSYRSAPGPAAATALSARRLVIAEPAPPAFLGLPSLGPVADAPGADVIRGAAATPGRVEREMGSATEIEVHAHGLVDLAAADTAFLALSPDADGRFALTAADVRRLRLAGRPIVYLAACRAAQVAPQRHEAWSLPVAFVAAGARAVIAAAAPVPERDASAFFAAVRARIAAGESPAAALARERAARLASDPASWVRSVMLFE